MTEADKYACAKRELALRKRVYPGLIQSGRLTQRVADHEIQCMEAIVQDYRKICDGERLI